MSCKEKNNVFKGVIKYGRYNSLFNKTCETIDEKGIRNTSEDFQAINEMEILSVEGEEQAKKLSENIELQNIDVIWSSNYTRAKATAKYIANENDLQYNLDKRLCERKLGNIEDLAKFMNDKESRDPSREQLAFPEFKTRMVKVQMIQIKG